MADKKVLRDDKSGERAPIHPDGQYVAVCADVVDLGYNVEQYQNNPPELKDKLALVYLTVDDDGKVREISREFTASIGKKANLRKWLEDWRGKAYTEAEVKQAGIPLEKMAGVPCMVSVTHKTSKSGSEYAYLMSISPCPKPLKDMAPSTAKYQRSDFWAKKQAEYLEAVKKFSPRNAPASSTASMPLGVMEQDAESDESDGLPF